MSGAGVEAEKEWSGLVVEHDTIRETRRQYQLFAGDSFIVGRAQDCDILVDDPTISNHHLHIYVIGFDDLKPDNIPPLVYAQDTSRHGTLLLRSPDATDDGLEVSPRTLSSTDPAYLTSHGDELHLSSSISLQFQFPHSGQVSISTREKIRKPEKQLFAAYYGITRRMIGEGGFGQVYLAFNRRTGNQVACKIIDVEALHAREQLRQKRPGGLAGDYPFSHIKLEVEILSMLNHPNIMNIESVFHSKSTAYIFTELVTAGDLMSFITHREGHLDDVGTAVIIRQILKAVEYLESKGIVHRDLKPENVLMTSLDEGSRIIVSDFGNARYLPSTKMSVPDIKSQIKLKRMFSLVGTLEYSAPEMYARNKHRGYSNAIDMWSIGTITALLLSGLQPFGVHNDSQLPEYEREMRIRSNAEHGNLESLNESQSWQTAGKRAKNFVTRLLVVDEEKRLTVGQALAHPWFSNRHHQKEFHDLYDRATAAWNPRSNGNVLVADLDQERQRLARTAVLQMHTTQAPVAEGDEEDELSQGYVSGQAKSKYF